MTAKEYLKQYKKLVDHARMMDAEIEAIEATVGSVTSDGMPHGSDVSDRTGQLAALLADMRTAYECERLRLWQKRREIVAVINSIDNADHVRLLYSKYILLKRWEDVAKEIYRSEEYTRGRLHSEALKAVDRIINSNG